MWREILHSSTDQAMSYLKGSSAMTDRTDTRQYSAPTLALLHPAPEITGSGHCDVHSKQKKSQQTTKKFQCFQHPTHRAIYGFNAEDLRQLLSAHFQIYDYSDVHPVKQGQEAHSCAGKKVAFKKIPQPTGKMWTPLGFASPWKNLFLNILPLRNYTLNYISQASRQAQAVFERP